MAARYAQLGNAQLKFRTLVRTGEGLKLVKSVSLHISQLKKLRPDYGGACPGSQLVVVLVIGVISTQMFFLLHPASDLCHKQT